MPIWLTFILAVFTAFRIALLIAEEDGPGDLALKLRNRLLEENGAPGWVDRGIRCFYCVSLWTSLPAALALMVLDSRFDPWYWPVTWLGMAGAAAWLRGTMDIGDPKV